MRKEEIEKILHKKVKDGEKVSPVLPEGIKNYLIDIDGTITEDIPNEEPNRMVNCLPFKDALLTCNKWFEEGHMICFFTSRLEDHREITETWLEKHGFKYHTLLMGKPRGGNYHWIDNHLVKATRYNGKFTDLIKKEVKIEVLMSDNLKVHTMADYIAEGKSPEVLFWIGCAGSFDDRAKKITKAFVKILNSINVDFAVLGQEESCSGDPAKRAGNEFLFQMQAISNIEVLNSYDIKTIVTTCPHCFNTLKNEYPSLGGNYKVYHHTQFLKSLLEQGRLKIKGGSYKGKKITYHDPCYLGRANNEYEAPRDLINKLEAELIEMKRCKKDGLCCGAGGAQMFKDAEKGNKEINIERTEDIKETNTKIVATGCPFCNTMLSDGTKTIEDERKISVMDISELIANAQEL